MSKWTHVVGSIRLEHFYWDKKSEEKLEGYKKTLEDIFRDTPQGSEGGLDVFINHDSYPSQSETINGKNEDVAYRWCVSVVGDLRDFTSIKAIVEWLEDKTKDLSVRDGIFLIESEGKKPIPIIHTEFGWLQYI